MQAGILTYDKGFLMAMDERTDYAAVDDPPAHGERMLTTTQVAEQLQLSVAFIRTAIREGRLQASLPAGSKNGYRIAPSAVERWLIATRAGPTRGRGSVR